ncbi:MAG: ABC transporter substrate-binding protein, partial [Pseudomonadota bacterium]
AIDEVGGDLSDGGAKMREVLANLEFETPTGMVKLDERRQAIGSIFLTEVVEGPDGNLLNKTIKVTENVNQTLGVDYEKFLEYGAVSRENPQCE